MLSLRGCLVLLGPLLGACANTQPPNAASEARNYRSQARGNYPPPGPAHDPWGPYIAEAAKRFDIPERWIREVMRQESGGRLFTSSGDLVTSGAGAMGLMQVMPGTYDELRERHEGLGDDPYEPRSNILAGAAYIREMYDMYGSPAFLAAYNAGPRRLDDYLVGGRGLPLETRRYVAKVGAQIAGTYPENRSPAEQYAMNNIPVNVPEGPRRGRGTGADQPTQFALASPEPPRGNTGGTRGPVQVAQLEEPAPAPRAVPPVHVASAAIPPTPPMAPAPSRGGFQLIPSAHAAPIARPAAGGGGNWAIQVGAFSNAQLARAAVGSAHRHAADAAANARQQVSQVKQGRNTLYRARLVGLSHEAATQACARLQRNRSNCVVLSPDAQG
jgi:soluble lytic murein transglycosylase-like protein